jgi:hypothetical protein
MSNKNWGEFSMMMVAGAGILIAGIFSESTATSAADACFSTSVVSTDGSVSPATTDAVTSGGAVAIGTGISIILFALSNKFNLLSNPQGRSIFMMMLASAMIIIGGISLSVKVNTVDNANDSNTDAQTQARLGGIVLGFGIGIILAALPKLIVSFTTKGKMGQNPDFLKKVNQLVLAGSTTLMALFAVIIGSWSWNISNKCAASSGVKSMNSGAAPVVNGIFTVLTALMCVYSAIYFGFRVADSPVADAMSDFKKMRTTAASAASKVAKAAGVNRSQPRPM